MGVASSFAQPRRQAAQVAGMQVHQHSGGKKPWTTLGQAGLTVPAVVGGWQTGLSTGSSCWGQQLQAFQGCHASTGGLRRRASIDRIQCTRHVSARVPLVGAVQARVGHSGQQTFGTCWARMLRVGERWQSFAQQAYHLFFCLGRSPRRKSTKESCTGHEEAM